MRIGARISTRVLALALLSSCEACGETSDGEGATTTGAGSEQTAGEESTSDDEVPVDPGPPPTLGLRVAPGDDGGQRLVVENRGSEPVELSTALALEAASGDGFAPVEEIQGLALRFDCEGDVPECITLIPGAALHPPPWTGDIGDAQCACERCVDAPEGTYRFVVTTCGGGHRVESAGFER